MVTERLPVLHRRTAAHPEELAKPALQSVGLSGDGCDQLAGLVLGHALAGSELRSGSRLAFLLILLTLATLGLIQLVLLALLSILVLLILFALTILLLILHLLALLLVLVLLILLTLTVLLLILLTLTILLLILLLFLVLLTLLLLILLLVLVLLILLLLILLLLILLLILLLHLLQGQLQVVFGVQVGGISQQRLAVGFDGRFPALGVEGRVAGIEMAALRDGTGLSDLGHLLQRLEGFLVLALAVEHVGGVVDGLGQLRRVGLRLGVGLQRLLVVLLGECLVANVGQLRRRRAACGHQQGQRRQNYHSQTPFLTHYCHRPSLSFMVLSIPSRFFRESHCNGAGG